MDDELLRFQDMREQNMPGKVSKHLMSNEFYEQIYAPTLVGKH